MGIGEVSRHPLSAQRRAVVSALRDDEMNQISILPALLGYAAGGAACGLWLAVVIVALLSGCGVSCHYDLVKTQVAPYPLYAVQEVCTRTVCTSQTRLPADATNTGVCP